MPIFVNLLIIDNNDEKVHKSMKIIGSLFVKMGKMRVFLGGTSVFTGRNREVEGFSSRRSHGACAETAQKGPAVKTAGP